MLPRLRHSIREVEGRAGVVGALTIVISTGEIVVCVEETTQVLQAFYGWNQAIVLFTKANTRLSCPIKM